MEYHVADLYEQNKNDPVDNLIIYTKNLMFNIKNILFDKNKTAKEYWAEKDMITLSINSLEANILILKDKKVFNDDTLKEWSDFRKYYSGFWAGTLQLVQREFGFEFRLEDEEYVRREMEYDEWLIKRESNIPKIQSNKLK